MRHRFYINDFDRIRDFREKYSDAGKIFEYPLSFWLGVRRRKDRNVVRVHDRVQRLMRRTLPAEPVLVLYNLPNRDLGHHSRGGAQNPQEYLNFIQAMSSAVGKKRKPLIVFEPDALPHSTMLSKAKQKRRLNLMKDALQILDDNCPEAHVYVDAGHSNWLEPSMAGKLINQVANAGTRGFSVNVSNFRTTEESMAWSLHVSEYTSASNFVIDTSRNGLGSYGNHWCNPPGRALGEPPTTKTGNDLCDAFLWIKIPGESDGRCNGGPRAGRFWPEYAVELVENTTWI